jgi:hypothetical protein
VLIAHLTVVCGMPRLVMQTGSRRRVQIPIRLGSTQHARSLPRIPANVATNTFAQLSHLRGRAAANSVGPTSRSLLSALDVATTPAAKDLCREALALDRRLFRLWHRFRGDHGVRGSPLTRAELIHTVLPIEKRLFALGERYLAASNAVVRNLAHAFLVINQHFFTFAYEGGVAPTKTPLSALRTAVQ